jgi:glycosyltransferase involved in cell wall biosynthesis
LTALDLALIQPTLDVKRGIQNIVAWVAAALAARGHRVRIVTAAFDPALWPGLAGIDVKVFPDLAGRRGRKPLSRRARADLRKAVDGAQLLLPHGLPSHRWAAEVGGPPAVWFCNEPSRKHFFPDTDRATRAWFESAPQAADAADEEVLAHARDGLAALRGLPWLAYLQRRWRERRAARCLAGILANSEYGAETARRVTGVPATVCTLGLPLPAAPQTPRASSGTPLVTVVATDHPAKNLSRAILALQAARAMGARFRAAIAGAGTDSEKYRALASGLEVRFLGAIPDAALHALYAETDVIVFTPLDEPFGLVPLEAAARGAAPLVSSHGGPSETIRHAITGLHGDAFSTAAIGAAVHRLVEDRDERTRLALAAAADVRAQFGLESFVDRYEAELRRLA